MIIQITMGYFQSTVTSYVSETNLPIQFSPAYCIEACTFPCPFECMLHYNHGPIFRVHRPSIVVGVCCIKSWVQNRYMDLGILHG